MNDKRKILKSVFAALLLTFVFFSMSPLISMAGHWENGIYKYFCTQNCPSVCGPDPNCSLYMSCPTECDGHKAEACDIVLSQPTCTTPGRRRIQHCVNVAEIGSCHERDVDVDIPALGHDFGAWVCDNDQTHSRACKRCGFVDRQKHNYCPKYPIAYQDNGDTHITTYRHDCYECRYHEIWTEIEEHVYQEWVINETDEHTATRVDELCTHTQSEWIGIELNPRNEWTTESGSISGLSKFWNDCDDSTPVAISEESITAKNTDTDVSKVVSETNAYTENREGRYEYTYTYTDNTNHEMSITQDALLIDHSAPQLEVNVTTGGTDNLGNIYTSEINYVESGATMSSDKGIKSAETKWTNVAPVITARATDFFKDTDIEGVGLHSVIIYDDEGHVVGSGTTNASYSLTLADEGTHTFTIVATDKLCRDAYRFGEAIFDSTAVYNATGAEASANYALNSFTAAYDVSHVTVTQVTTHFDCTAPIMVGTEDVFTDTNIDDIEYKFDRRTVYIKDNTIEQIINDFPSNSLNGANDSSDIEKIVLLAYDKDENRTTLSSATRKDANSWVITQGTGYEYAGSGYKLPAANRSYGKEDLIPITENDVDVNGGKTVTRPTSSLSVISLNTDSRYYQNTDGTYSKIDPVTEAMLEEMRGNYEYYAIQVTDIAGNKTIKKFVPDYSVLRTIHTTIDPSSYGH